MRWVLGGGPLGASEERVVGHYPIAAVEGWADSPGMKLTRRMRNDELIERCREVIDESENLRRDVSNSRLRNRELLDRLKQLSRTSIVGTGSSISSPPQSPVSSDSVR